MGQPGGGAVMGHELYRMILGGHPPGWSTAMLAVALVIADDATEPSRADPDHPACESTIPVRGCWRTRAGARVWRDGIAERAGLSERAISRALTRLAEAGFELRVPIEAGDGRGAFAAKGHALRFRVPRVEPRADPPDPQRTTKPATFAKGDVKPGGRRKGRRIGSQRTPDLVPKDDKNVVPIPSIPPPVSFTASHPFALTDVEGSRETPETGIDDQDSGGNSDHPRPASPRRDATESDRAYEVVREFARGRDGGKALGASVFVLVVELLKNGIEEERIAAALPAWLESGKPPEALGEFVKPPAEREAAP
jgi:hypothetical protein